MESARGNLQPQRRRSVYAVVGRLLGSLRISPKMWLGGSAGDAHQLVRYKVFFPSHLCWSEVKRASARRNVVFLGLNSSNGEL